ncbi:hypothetical protein BS329_15515 [Amycolatopsis coloradensis]|uniref:Uncharacterized protein n=1 Tax=Amycolatopsis coloradensis TaxID=76021 RepID=A0A1R0KU86_9PSEU|nr:hypothetical protein [Amycolatopsis coloradensis]OLZ51671.1 hypothetical protein BS329_15515 [Amycolatopsis coloradensis]
MRELTDEPDPKTHRPEPPLRFNTYFHDQLRNAQALAELALWGAAAIVFYLIVIAHPELWLWPAATGRSPQHLLTGGVIALLLLMVIRVGRDVIYGDRGWTHHPQHLDTYKRIQLDRDGRALARTTSVAYLALIALLIAPVVPDLAMAWSANIPAAFTGLGPQLALRLAPAALLYLLHAALGWGLNLIAENLANRQDAEIEDVQRPPVITALQ